MRPEDRYEKRVEIRVRINDGDGWVRAEDLVRFDAHQVKEIHIFTYEADLKPRRRRVAMIWQRDEPKAVEFSIHKVPEGRESGPRAIIHTTRSEGVGDAIYI